MSEVFSILRRRDEATREDFREMLEEFEDAVAAGDDPEDAFMEVFALEPDFLISDPHVFAAVCRGLQRKS